MARHSQARLEFGGVGGEIDFCDKICYLVFVEVIGQPFQFVHRQRVWIDILEVPSFPTFYDLLPQVGEIDLRTTGHLEDVSDGPSIVIDEETPGRYGGHNDARYSSSTLA